MAIALFEAAATIAHGLSPTVAAYLAQGRAALAAGQASAALAYGRAGLRAAREIDRLRAALDRTTAAKGT